MSTWLVLAALTLAGGGVGAVVAIAWMGGYYGSQLGRLAARLDRADLEIAGDVDTIKDQTNDLTERVTVYGQRLDSLDRQAQDLRRRMDKWEDWRYRGRRG